MVPAVKLFFKPAVELCVQRALIITLPTALCRAGDGSAVVTASLCPAAAEPPMAQECKPCDFCDDPAQHAGCSGHGRCADGSCVCKAPYGGVTCAVDSAACPGAVRDADGACCASGVVDAEGACCVASSLTRAPVLDVAGACCGEGLDACGVCGGSGVAVDVLGKCCSVCGTFV
jgi:hypothetical protein